MAAPASAKLERWPSSFSAHLLRRSRLPLPWRRSRPLTRSLLLCSAVVAAAVFVSGAWRYGDAFVVTARETQGCRTASAKRHLDGKGSSLNRLGGGAVANSAASKTAEAIVTSSTPSLPAFDLSLAVLLAGYAFETYNTPEAARWERGENGCDVALLSKEFLPNVFKGVLTVTVNSAEGLRGEESFSESVLTGGRSDPYVLLNVMEEGSMTLLTTAGPGKGSINKLRQEDALDVARTSTRWAERWFGNDEDIVRWGENQTGETHRLYVRDPLTARLGVRVMDENIAKEDILLGAAELELNDHILGTDGYWNGSVPLLFKEEGWDWGLAGVGAAATAVTGIATGGASLLAGAALMAAKAVMPAGTSGALGLTLQYSPLESAPASEIRFSGSPPVGASPDVNWGQLAAEFGGLAGEGSAFDFLGFISHRDTNTQAGIWRDVASKRLLVAFRGTQQDDIRDFITDATIVKTPWEAPRDDREPEDSVPQVHAGFRRALDSVAQRLKDLIAAACGNTEDWEIFFTGHSLGGALATLMAVDIAGGLDPSRSLPLAPEPAPWFGLFGSGQEIPESPPKLFKRVTLYSFGAPRVGNQAFADLLNRLVPDAFRIVNSQDVVARLPRGGYEHGGRTVLLLNETAGDRAPGSSARIGLWVEGEDVGRCPLRTDKPISGLLDSKSLLGSLYEEIEAGPLAELRGAADRVTADAAELRHRLASATGNARQELSELVAAAEASAAELRAASDRASSLGDELAVSWKRGDRGEELEKHATEAVAADLRRALEQATKLSERGKKLSSAWSAVTSGNISGAAQASGAAAEAASAFGIARDAFSGAGAVFTNAARKAQESVTSRFTGASASDWATLVGIDKEYADAEVRLLSALGGGDAIISHLEPSYFRALATFLPAGGISSSGTGVDALDA